MLNIQPYQESQKLIKCHVSAIGNPSSTRYIELENYKMWEYMVTTKHGLDVADELVICLWVHEEEFIRNEDIYKRSGNVKPVNRLIIMINDENYGFYYSASRFVPAEKTAMVKEILLSHVAEGHKHSDYTTIEVIPGYSIEQKSLLEESEPVLGLTQETTAETQASAET